MNKSNMIIMKSTLGSVLAFSISPFEKQPVIQQYFNLSNVISVIDERNIVSMIFNLDSINGKTALFGLDLFYLHDYFNQFWPLLFIFHRCLWTHIHKYHNTYPRYFGNLSDGLIGFFVFKYLINRTTMRYLLNYIYLLFLYWFGFHCFDLILVLT